MGLYMRRLSPRSGFGYRACTHFTHTNDFAIITLMNKLSDCIDLLILKVFAKFLNLYNGQMDI